MKIQKQGIKTVSELIADGATAADLPQDTQVYITANSLNKTLNQAIIDADFAAASPIFAMAEFSTNVAVSGRLNFDNVLSDALSTITTGASWVFTAPRNDTYRVNVNYQGNTGAAMHIYANGSFYRGISDVVTGLSVSSTVDVPLLSGQTIYIVEASAGYTSQGGGNVNWIQIVA